jgi:hypothetical protein
MKTIRFNKITAILLMFIVFSSINILGKTQLQDDKKITEIASILTQKVLLSNDQEAKVINILSGLQNGISAKPENKNELIKDAQTKIENLLDKKQKMKYDIIKNDFWKKIQ